MRKRFKGYVLAVAAGSLITTVAVHAARADDAKGMYERTCSPCHGATGKGDGVTGKLLKPPPADFATALPGRSDADLAKVIKDGGKAVGKSPAMPAFGSRFNDDQIKGVVDYIKGLK